MAQLFSGLVEEIAIFVVLAFIIGRAGLFTAFFTHLHGWKEKAMLSLGAGLIGIMGTYWGIPVQGALANTRVVGPMLAGLYGGPLAGLAAGAIAGIHRWSLGGFTGFACALSTMTEGVLAGYVHKRLGGKPLSAGVAFLATAMAEAMQMIIILLVARPFDDALTLVQVIAWPMTLANGLGVGLMVAIIGDATEQRERIRAQQAQQALRIAGQTLPHLREGLNAESAQATAEIILRESTIKAASITDRAHIIGFAGLGADHHKVGVVPMLQATWDVLANGQPRVVNSPAEVGCSHPGCPLSVGVVVPLRDGVQVVGSLHLYEGGRAPVSPVTVELGLGLGQLLSTQIEISRVQAMANLATQAEIRALHAQINPHFLFNALNTMGALIRKNPEQARDLLVMLSQYLRSSIRAADGMVTLGQELEVVEAYLAIERARYGDRLKSQIDVAEDLKGLTVPTLSLQPLVENSIRHGLMPRASGGTVRVSARMAGTVLVLMVEDDGLGIGNTANGKTSGHGVALKNVRERLRHLYGAEGTLALTGVPGGGTLAELRLPTKAAAPGGGVLV